MKRILIITTGGTIACKETESGLAPQTDGGQLIRDMGCDFGAYEIDVCSLMSLDSSNIRPKDISLMAEAVNDHYEAYDGFVITHGTDTMAYSASALSYMLTNLGKPISITGSQKTVNDLFTDAKRNLTDAVVFAAEGIPGVFIVFGGKIINGVRGTKLYSQSAEAFSSLDYPLVGEFSAGKLQYSKEMFDERYSKDFSRPSAGSFRCMPQIDPHLVLIKLHPGIDNELLEFCRINAKAVVLETYGVGGVPSLNGGIKDKIRELIENGIHVAVSTQCLYEGTRLGVYEVGLFDLAGIIDARDMCTEALTMKLMWAIGNLSDRTSVKRFIETSWQGDRTGE